MLAEVGSGATKREHECHHNLISESRNLSSWQNSVIRRTLGQCETGVDDTAKVVDNQMGNTGTARNHAHWLGIRNSKQ